MKSRVIKIIIIFVVLALLAAAGGAVTLRYLYPQRYSGAVTRYAEEYGLDPALVYAIIKCESNFDKDAVSKADARGLMQITHETFEWAAKRQNDSVTDNSLFDPDTNIRYGCIIFSMLYDEFDDVSVALAAYNAGRSRVMSWLSNSKYSSDGKTLDVIPFAETDNYVKKVIKTYKIYQFIY